MMASAKATAAMAAKIGRDQARRLTAAAAAPTVAAACAAELTPDLIRASLDAESRLLASLAVCRSSTVCAGCGGRKAALGLGPVICDPCARRIPKRLRESMVHKLGNSYLAALADALELLRAAAAARRRSRPSRRRRGRK